MIKNIVDRFRLDLSNLSSQVIRDDIHTVSMVFDVLVGRQTTVVSIIPSSLLPLSVVSITSLDGSTDERRVDGYVEQPRRGWQIGGNCLESHVQMTSAKFSEFRTPSPLLLLVRIYSIGITQPPFLSPVCRLSLKMLFPHGNGIEDEGTAMEEGKRRERKG